MAGRSGKETSDDHEYLSSRVCVARGAGAPGALVADPPEPTSPGRVAAGVRGGVVREEKSGASGAPTTPCV